MLLFFFRGSLDDMEGISRDVLCPLRRYRANHRMIKYKHR